MWIIIVFWRALGFTLAWDKGSCSFTVEWIGAQIAPWKSSTGKIGVLITLPEEKLLKLREQIESLLASGPTVCKKILRSFTGLMSWVANLCPQVNAFTRMRWAAWAQDARRIWVYSRQISWPLQWLPRLQLNKLAPCSARLSSAQRCQL